MQVENHNSEIPVENETSDEFNDQETLIGYGSLQIKLEKSLGHNILFYVLFTISLYQLSQSFVSTRSTDMLMMQGLVGSVSEVLFWMYLMV